MSTYLRLMMKKVPDLPSIRKNGMNSKGKTDQLEARNTDEAGKVFTREKAERRPNICMFRKEENFQFAL